MSESVRSRMAARGWVTRASRKLDKLCNVRDIDNLKLRDSIEELDRRLKTLDNAQSVSQQNFQLNSWRRTLLWRRSSGTRHVYHVCVLQR